MQGNSQGFRLMSAERDHAGVYRVYVCDTELSVYVVHDHVKARVLATIDVKLLVEGFVLITEIVKIITEFYQY